MKLKFERFEGLASFSARGPMSVPEAKILQIGLEKIAKELESPLVINLSMATIPPVFLPVFQSLKKSLLSLTKYKIHWISPDRAIADFTTLQAFTTRLTGFKHRQIGERLILDDETFHLNDQLLALKEKFTKVTGDEKKGQEMILENLLLKEQERILRETIRFQKERMKLQVHVPTVNEELPDKLSIARAALKKFYGDIEL